jgi:hypothetical protein
MIGMIKMIEMVKGGYEFYVNNHVLTKKYLPSKNL